MEMNKNDQFKVVLVCPICGEKELQVTKEDDANQLMQCISCGYSSSNEWKGKLEDNPKAKELSEDIKKFAIQKEGRVWIPSVVQLPIGMVYPFDYQGEMKWSFAPIVDIPEDEQKNYPRGDGGFYNQRYDLDSKLIYNTFKDCLVTINETNQRLEKERASQSNE
tara:strand:- start:12730 stop:13221 length:492 start_codon:yes stop_codon:yes gene_type:complete